MRTYRLIDLFAGCGGLTEGFEQTGKYETMACIEWNKACRDTLIKRLNDKWHYNDVKKRVLRFDIQRTDELLNGWADNEEYGYGTGLKSLIPGPEVDFIIGGPPCQAYSVAGRIRDENGMHNDYRNYLFESYLRIVDHYKPLAVIFENVPGMLSAAPGGIPIVDRITEAFKYSGYEIVDNMKRDALIDLTLFGIPQKRKRVILLGLNKSFFGKKSQELLHKFYEDILPKYYSKERPTVSDVIGDLPKLFPSDKDCKINGKNYSHKPHLTDIPNHSPRYNNRRDIQIFRDLSNDLASEVNHYDSIEKIKDLYHERTGKKSNIHKYYVLRWNEPSNTIPAHLYKDGLRHIHPDPEQARTITVREAARLQTFEDDFIFLGNMGEQYKMVGNAVPPRFARALGTALYEFIEKFGNKGDINAGAHVLCEKII